MRDEEDVRNEFLNVLEKLTDEEWWTWVQGWYDVDMIIASYKNWDESLYKEEIKIIQKIISRRKEK